MKSLSTIFAMLVVAMTSFAQEREIFDLTNFAPPSGWARDVQENYMGFSIIEKKNWGQMGIYKSITSKGSSELDFESEWNQLIATQYNITGTSPDNAAEEADGWRIKAGGGRFTFNGKDALAMLITVTGYNRCISIVTTANNKVHQQQMESFLATLEFIKPEIISMEVPEVISNEVVENNNTESIHGIWRRGIGGADYRGNWTSTGYQYDFKSNGTYTYVRRTFTDDDPETLLTRESGSYSVNGNTVTLDPKTNEIEAWSKSNGGDNYKALVSRQYKPLEKITYQFVKQFVPEKKETVLFLLYPTVTARDGKYEGTDSYPNAWRFSPAGPDYKPIKLPGE